jgi:uncharacterized OB-fold protein
MFMPETSPVLHRAQKNRKADKAGTVLAVTTLMHPPSRFGPRPRILGLIELEDGKRVMGALTGPCAIGDRVMPRLRLSSVNAEGLRRYVIVAYAFIGLNTLLQSRRTKSI